MANYDSNPSNVKLVQHAINVAGYSPQLAEDGVYGNKTKTGVVWFQTQHGLTPDGIIGDATMAAAGPTPPGADPLAGLRASIAALKATQDAAAAPAAGPIGPKYTATGQLDFSNLGDLSVAGAAAAAAAAAAAPKVIHLSLHAPSTPTDATMAVPAPASLATGTALVAAATPSSPLVPVGIGAAVGAALGAALSTAVVAVPLLALVGGGAVLGAAAGFGFSKMQGSTMHGEADFGIDFGLEDPDELSVVAGEIGMESKIYTLRG